MKKNITRSLLPLVLLCGLFLFTACSANGSPQETVIPFSEMETEVVPTEIKPYPSNAEDVIREFLVIYPASPENAVQYLSPAYVLKLNENSVLSLLPEPGAISGYVINAGSSSAETERGEVRLSIAYGDKAYEVTFLLVIGDGRWMIEEIVF